MGCRVVGGRFEGNRPAGGARRCREALGERDRPAARRALLRSQGTATWMHTTHHHPIAYYYDDATQRLHIFTVHYHYYTPKFPSHIVGVPSAGSFYRFKLLSRSNLRHCRRPSPQRPRHRPPSGPHTATRTTDARTICIIQLPNRLCHHKSAAGSVSRILGVFSRMCVIIEPHCMSLHLQRTFRVGTKSCRVLSQ